MYGMILGICMVYVPLSYRLYVLFGCAGDSI